jgi:hypothetical protein
MNTLSVGTKFYRKHCGHTAFHVTEHTWNQPIKKKREREDTSTIADEQPSTLGEPDFRKVLGYRSP